MHGKPPLWSRDELAQVFSVDADSLPEYCTGVSLDSRTLQPGDLFIALSGKPDPRYHGAAGSGRDGHAYVAAAARAGAAAALVEQATHSGIAELRVADTFTGLWQLARAARARYRQSGRVIALTGSSGKSTVKSILAAALHSLRRSVHVSAGNLNNHLGVPLSLARLPADVELAVLELGTSSVGEIAPLSELVQPHVALVLNVLGVHLDGLGDVQGVRREKLSIARGLLPGGKLLVHEAIATDALQGDFQLLRFGRSQRADVRLDDAQGTDVQVHFPDGAALPCGRLMADPHRRLSATAALGCLWLAGCNPGAQAVAAVTSMPLPSGRGNVRVHVGVHIIDDSYNANPDSVRHALHALQDMQVARRYALLGDMRELGAAASALHAGLAADCADLDGVFCVGALAWHLYEALPARLRLGWWPDCHAMELTALLDILRPGDGLLVKASNRLFWQDRTVDKLAGYLDAQTDQS